MLCSCSLPAFFGLLESLLYPDPNVKLELKENEAAPKQYDSEDAFVSDFLTYLQDELTDFEERVEVMIKTLEGQMYYTSHDDELNKKEKEKYE
jgi:hypothetical protein